MDQKINKSRWRNIIVINDARDEIAHYELDEMARIKNQPKASKKISAFMKHLSMKNEIRNMNGIYQIIPKKSKLSFTGNIEIFSLQKESLTETNPIIINDCIEEKSKLEKCIKIKQSSSIQDSDSNFYNIIDFKYQESISDNEYEEKIDQFTNYL